MKAVLHRHIATDTTTGRLDYETIDLTDAALSVHVIGEIVMVKRGGGDFVAAAKLGERDYIKFEPESAAGQQ